MLVIEWVFIHSMLFFSYVVKRFESLKAVYKFPIIIILLLIIIIVMIILPPWTASHGRRPGWTVHRYSYQQVSQKPCHRERYWGKKSKTKQKQPTKTKR